jgi:hypothetical protein
MTTRDEYHLIIETWDNRNYNKIYHMIVDWIIKNKDSIKSQKEIKSIATRMSDPTEELQDIVYDFMDGDLYKNLRNEFA